jgi:hypothetical protein
MTTVCPSRSNSKDAEQNPFGQPLIELEQTRPSEPNDCNPTEIHSSPAESDTLRDGSSTFLLPTPSEMVAEVLRRPPENRGRYGRSSW